jgi:signal transduction histidine kinase
MGNAIKFTPIGGRLELDARADGDFVCFSVRDNGPGISPEQVPRLFERYWQAKHDSRHGIGLGLSIARGIVEAHGGTIWSESTLGAGATFHFTLPVEPPAQVPRTRST